MRHRRAELACCAAIKMHLLPAEQTCRSCAAPESPALALSTAFHRLALWAATSGRWLSRVKMNPPADIRSGLRTRYPAPDIDKRYPAPDIDKTFMTELIIKHELLHTIMIYKTSEHGGSSSCADSDAGTLRIRGQERRHAARGGSLLLSCKRPDRLPARSATPQRLITHAVQPVSGWCLESGSGTMLLQKLAPFTRQLTRGSRTGVQQSRGYAAGAQAHCRRCRCWGDP